MNHNFHLSPGKFSSVDSVYRPSEDSYLLQSFVERLVSGRVLDMGTGSGIQAITAAEKTSVTQVVAVDNNPEALEATRKRAVEAGVLAKVTLVLSDLFEKVEGRFDWILFNAPYLPSEGTLNDPAWVGGKRGSEVIERFLIAAHNYLSTSGSIILIYSSETGFTGDCFGYNWAILGEKKLFFETLYCTRLSPS